MAQMHIDKRSKVRETLGLAVSAMLQKEHCLAFQAVGLFVLFFLAGCRQPTTQQPEGFKHFKAIAVAYGKFQGSHGGSTPKNLDEFKAFVEKSQAGMLTRFGLENAGELFVSPRDREPLVFDFSNSGNSVTNQIVAYEQTGVGGKRVVVSTLGSVELLDEEQFRQRVPGQ